MSNGDGDKEGDGDGDNAKGWVRVAGDKMGIGNGGKSKGYGDKVGGQEIASRAMVRATVMQWRGPP